MEENKNYYGSLCTELYEILHPQAPQDELEFYLSYARPGQKILEPLCGSGRFLVPFLAQGLDICGMDWSKEMLEKLRQKAPGAKAIQADLLTYTTDQRFDYIFISSGSVSLFTDLDVCRQILRTLKELLTPEGRLVFAVDTVAERCPDDDGYKMSVQVKTGAGEDLVLRTQNRYDERTQTQFSPGIYELYRGTELVGRERMEFQTHLYRFGEMEGYLRAVGFQNIRTYSSFEKEPAVDGTSGMFLLECTR